MNEGDRLRTLADHRCGGPGRTRTCNQTVMSGPVCSILSENIDVFRGAARRSSSFVHAVSVVNRWLEIHCGVVVFQLPEMYLSRKFRAFVADTMNAALAEEGKAQLVHVEHRSFKARGSSQVPTRHQGVDRTNAKRQERKRAGAARERANRTSQRDRHAQELAALQTRQESALASKLGQLAEREKLGIEAIRKALGSGERPRPHGCKPPVPDRHWPGPAFGFRPRGPIGRASCHRRTCNWRPEGVFAGRPQRIRDQTGGRAINAYGSAPGRGPAATTGRHRPHRLRPGGRSRGPA